MRCKGIRHLALVVIFGIYRELHATLASSKRIQIPHRITTWWATTSQAIRSSDLLTSNAHSSFSSSLNFPPAMNAVIRPSLKNLVRRCSVLDYYDPLNNRQSNHTVLYIDFRGSPYAWH